MENQKKEAQKLQEKLAKKLEKKQNEENSTVQQVRDSNNTMHYMGQQQPQLNHKLVNFKQCFPL